VVPIRDNSGVVYQDIEIIHTLREFTRGSCYVGIIGDVDFEKCRPSTALYDRFRRRMPGAGISCTHKDVKSPGRKLTGHFVADALFAPVTNAVFMCGDSGGADLVTIFPILPRQQILQQWLWIAGQFFDVAQLSCNGA